MWLKPSAMLINGVETDLQIVEMLLEEVKNYTSHNRLVAAEKQSKNIYFK